MNFQKTETVTKTLSLRVLGEAPSVNPPHYAGGIALQQFQNVDAGRPATAKDLAECGFVPRADVRRIAESAVNHIMNAVAGGYDLGIGEALGAMLEQLEAL